MSESTHKALKVWNVFGGTWMMPTSLVIGTNSIFWLIKKKIIAFEIKKSYGVRVIASQAEGWMFESQPSQT